VHRHHRIVLASVLIALVGGCASDADLFGIVPRVEPVPGIVARDESGEVVGIWGNPVSTGGVAALPNPSSGRVGIVFENPTEQRVRVRILRLLDPRESPEDVQSVLGTSVARNRSALERTLVDEVLPDGAFNVIWDGTDGERRSADGFYRVRILFADGTEHIDDILLWRGDPSDLPADIRRLLQI